MVKNSIGANVSDLIWVLSSGHIGITRAILQYVHFKYGITAPDAEEIEIELRSVGLLKYIGSSCRGATTFSAFYRLVTENELSDKTGIDMEKILKIVASGKVFRSDEPRVNRKAAVR
ncbi:hypothetical protein V7S43_018392 [Phytophthora oleae]|uniref:Uncharacterized protein n=1 Tax=Phytophthora oleae TaxID=2107226 RepID=A0ABD3EQL6_9STRA